MTYRWLEEHCDRCGYTLQTTQHQGYAYCASCRQYKQSHSPWAGHKWRGFWIPESCKFCGQPIQDTSDPHMNYCPNCGKYQRDKVW